MAAVQSVIAKIHKIINRDEVQLEGENQKIFLWLVELKAVDWSRRWWGVEYVKGRKLSEWSEEWCFWNEHKKENEETILLRRASRRWISNDNLMSPSRTNRRDSACQYRDEFDVNRERWENGKRDRSLLLVPIGYFIPYCPLCNCHAGGLS
jgi:hypothetical protein